jgi:hypothetical protein
MSLPDLVAMTEDLLESEHKAWLPQMLSTQHLPAANSKGNRAARAGHGLAPETHERRLVQGLRRTETSSRPPIPSKTLRAS